MLVVPARLVWLPCLALLLPAPAAGHVITVVPWRSPEGHVALMRPDMAAMTADGSAPSTVLAAGWQPLRDVLEPHQAASPGRVLLRLSMRVRLADAHRDGQGVALLQIGVGDDPACLSGAQAFRTIGSVRYVVRATAAVGARQHLQASEYRAVVGGRCYAVDRIRAGDPVGARDPAPYAWDQDFAAAQFDLALASLRIGAGIVDMPAIPFSLFPGAVDR